MRGRRPEDRDRERLASVSFSGTRPCHLTPATERAWGPCPLGRKSGPTNRNPKEEFMQIATAKGNECPLMFRARAKTPPASFKDSHSEDYKHLTPLLDVLNTAPALIL